MTLGSGTIDTFNINIECGEATPYTQQVSLNDVDVRTLAGIASGQISFFNLRSKTFYGGKGYCVGGYSSSTTALTAVQGINYSNEAADNPSVTMADGSFPRVGGTYAGIRGYAVNDVTGNQFIDGLIFSNDSSYNPSSTLANPIRSGSMTSASRMYCQDNVTGTAVNYINFSDDTSSSLSSILATSRTAGAGISNHATGTGFICSGYISGKVTTYSTEIDGINFSNETANNPSTAVAETIGEWLYNGAGNFHQTRKSIWSGRQNAGTRNDIDGFSHSDLTVNNPSSVLSSARSSVTACGNRLKLYFCGGGTMSSYTLVSTIDAWVNSADTCSAISATLPETAVGRAGKMTSGGNTIY